MSDRGRDADKRREPRPGDVEFLAAVRRELNALKLKAPGEVSVGRLRSGSPILCAAAEARFPGKPLTDLPLRELLREAADACEPKRRADAARDLFGLWNETYGKTLSYRRESAAKRFDKVVSTFRQGPEYEAAVVEEMAARLINLLSQPPPLVRDRLDRQYIDRPDYMRQLQDAIGAQAGVTLVWGEPGVGKSWLVDAFLRDADLYPVAHIRMSSAMEFASSARRALSIAQADTSALPADGFVELLESAIANSANVGAWVVEEADDAPDLQRLVEAATGGRTPMFVVSRTRIALPEVEQVHVREFSPEQAAELCVALGAVDPPTDLEELCRVLGYRPLAVYQAIKFLRHVGRLTAADLARGILSEPATTLDTVARTIRAGRNLAYLYRQMLQELAQDVTVSLCIDAMVWLSSDGRIADELLRVYVLSGAEDSAALVRFEAALSILYDAGLIDVESGAESDLHSVELTSDIYVMHRLTWQMLAELQRARGDLALQLLAAILKVPAPDPRDLQAMASRSHTQVVRAVLHAEWVVGESLERTNDDLRQWGFVVCLSTRGWLHAGPPQEPDGHRSIKLYDIWPGAVYELAGGVRNAITRETAIALRHAILLTRDVLRDFYSRKPGGGGSSEE